MLPRSKNATLIEEYEKILVEKIDVPDEFIDDVLTFEIMDHPVQLGHENYEKNATLEELKKSIGEATLKEMMGLPPAEDLNRSVYRYDGEQKAELKENIKVIYTAERMDENSLLAYASWTPTGKMINPNTNAEVDCYSHDHELQQKIDAFMSSLKARVDAKNEKSIPKEFLEEDIKARKAIEEMQEKRRQEIQQKELDKLRYLLVRKDNTLSPEGLYATLNSNVGVRKFSLFQPANPNNNNQQALPLQHKQHGGPKFGLSMEDID